MKTARHEKLKSQGDRLLLGGGSLFEHGQELNASFRQEYRSGEDRQTRKGNGQETGGIRMLDREGKTGGGEREEEGGGEERKKSLRMQKGHTHSWCRSYHM